MEFSRFRNEQVRIENRLLVYRVYNYENCTFENLIETANYLKTVKSNFKYLVDNFENLDDKEFFKYYKTFYKWNNDKLGTNDLAPAISFLFKSKPNYLNDQSIDVMYNEHSDAFKLIKSEFTKEILQKDYEEYCKVQKRILSDIAKAFVKKMESKQKQVENIQKELSFADEFIKTNL